MQVGYYALSFAKLLRKAEHTAAYHVGQIAADVQTAAGSRFFGALEQEPIDTVFHCAANVKHFSSGTDIEDINIGGTANALRFIETTGARLIHFSTTSVGGALKGSDPLQVRRLDEQSLIFNPMEFLDDSGEEIHGLSILGKLPMKKEYNRVLGFNNSIITIPLQ